MREDTRSALVAKVLYPLGFFILSVLIWHMVTTGFDVPGYIFPAPGSVVDAFFEIRPQLWDHVWVTLVEAFSGFLIAAVSGVLLGVLIARFKVLMLTLYPYLIGLYTVPIIALAPLLIIWFGFGMLPKIVVAALISFLPVVINTLRGLGSADYRAVELMQLLAASESETFRKIRFPTALPYILASFKIAVPAAVVGAVVGEFLGSDRGLGALIIRGTSRLQTDLLFVSIGILGILGICLFLLIVLIESTLLSWYEGTTTL